MNEQTKLELLKIAAQLTTADAILKSKSSSIDNVSGVDFSALEPTFSVTTLFKGHTTYLIENFDKLGNAS